MREQLLAYLLNDLEPAERSALEDRLAADPDLQKELDKLRQCLAPSDDAAGADPPPPKLALRTCSFVDHAIKKSQAICGDVGGGTPRIKSLSESHEPLARRKKWSLLDMAAAACVLVALGALTLPALQVSREDARRATCQDNLHQLGAALMDYTLRFNEGLPRIEPGMNAGMYVITLADRGVVSREELARLVVCPSTELAERVGRGCVRIRIPSYEEYVAATGAYRQRLGRHMGGDYAYSLGFEDEAGELQQVSFSGSRFVPLLADKASSAIAGYQSANHGGCGQNVLFQDLSIRYCTQCKCQERRDHWFLNDDGQPAAGLHRNDLVLGASWDTPIIDLRVD